jgi:hypothetical protein
MTKKRARPRIPEMTKQEPKSCSGEYRITSHHRSGQIRASPTAVIPGQYEVTTAAVIPGRAQRAPTTVIPGRAQRASTAVIPGRTSASHPCRHSGAALRAEPGIRSHEMRFGPVELLLTFKIDIGGYGFRARAARAPE